MEEKELKYIIDKYNNFAIFSKANQHSDIAKSFYSQPIAAGFCHITAEHKIKCYGKSISLNLQSRKEDSEIIQKALN
jgi:hypothetical protein